MFSPELISALASSILAGDLDVESVVSRASHTLGHPWEWLRPLARRLVKQFEGRTRPRHRDVVQFLEVDPGVRSAWRRLGFSLVVQHWIAEPQIMRPVPAARHWPIPSIDSAGALAEWLWLDPEHLDWYADLK